MNSYEKQRLFTKDGGIIEQYLMTKKIEKDKECRVIFSPITFPMPKDGDKWIYSGKNAGNLVFVHSAIDNLKHDAVQILEPKWKRDNLGKKCVKGLMPSSNFICRNTWVQNLNDIIENTDMSFTLCGLGSQAKLSQTPQDIVDYLDENQRKFFKLVSERCDSIGVRGEFTAECLNIMGIKNVSIIGCPSIYDYKHKFLELPEANFDNAIYTTDSRKDKMYAIGRELRATLVCQNPNDARDTKPTIFFDYKQWKKYLLRGNFTACIGTRFHGNMMALKNNIPALFVVHDWRTLELCRTLKLPFVMYDDKRLEDLDNLNSLLEAFDYSALYREYPILKRNFDEYIKRNF